MLLSQIRYIPGLISKELAEITILSYALPLLEEYFERAFKNIKRRKLPKTLTGFQKYLDDLTTIAIDGQNSLQLSSITEILNIYRASIDGLSSARDSENEKLAQIALDVITITLELFTKHATRKQDALELHSAVTNIKFNLAEETRRLIQLHSRRSRYLY